MFNKSVKMDNRKKNPLDAEYTSRGFLMPRGYQHISNYEDKEYTAIQRLVLRVMQKCNLLSLVRRKKFHYCS